jgi:hypothetical protein
MRYDGECASLFYFRFEFHVSGVFGPRPQAGSIATL